MDHPENDSQYAGLTVNSGVAQPPIVNPYRVARRRKPLPTASELVEGILKGNGYGGLNPAGTATRAECAVMLDRFIGLL